MKKKDVAKKMPYHKQYEQTSREYLGGKRRMAGFYKTKKGDVAVEPYNKKYDKQ